MGARIQFVGGPRDGESSSIVSGEPRATLVVDDSGWVYRYRDGGYWWELTET